MLAPIGWVTSRIPAVPLPLSRAVGAEARSWEHIRVSHVDYWIKGTLLREPLPLTPRIGISGKLQSGAGTGGQDTEAVWCEIMG